MLQRSSACLVITILSGSVVLTGAPALAADEVPATGGPPSADSVVQVPATTTEGAPAVVAAAYELKSEANKYPGTGANVYTLSVTRNGAPVNVDGFDPEVQDLVRTSLDALRYLGTSPEDPLLVLDPFGTNTTGVYTRFATQGEGALSYTVSAAGAEDFTRTAKDQDEDPSSFEGQLIGVVPGVENTVAGTWRPADGEAQEFSFTITAPPSASSYRTSLARTVEGDAEQLTEGLFSVVGLTRYPNHGPLYDNAGTLRAEFELDGYRMDRIEFYEGTMLTSVAPDRMARIDGLGRVVETYALEGYGMHHDFVLGANGKVLILATETGTDSIEDVLLSLDLETGEHEEVVDFSDLLADYKALAAPYATYSGVVTNDWLHLNSVDYSAAEDSVIVSARETSGILKVGDVHGTPVLEYVIGEADVWAGTSVEPFLLRKAGDFPDSGGQHSVVRHDDASLPDGQYRLTMFDNAYWQFKSRPGYTGRIPEGTSTVATGDPSLRSQYRTYLVDEGAGTYELVESFSVPYSAIVSNVQDLGGPLVINSGQAHTFAEYDAEHNLIARYDYAGRGYGSGDFAYRVLKYTFDDFWFNGE